MSRAGRRCRAREAAPLDSAMSLGPDADDASRTRRRSRPRAQDARPQRQRLLRRQAGAEGRVDRHSRGSRHGLHRPVGLRQVDLPALPQPDERHDPVGAGDRPHRARRRGHQLLRRWTSSSSAPGSGMVFQKPNPFPKSIYENVAYGPRIHGLAAVADGARRDRREVAASAPACGTRSRTGCRKAARRCRAGSSSGCASRARSRSIPR